MELTNKCKEDFEKWYIKNQHPTENIMSHEQFMHVWYLTRNDSEKFGMFQDFFNENNIKISIQWLDNEYCIEIAIPEKTDYADYIIKFEENSTDLDFCRKLAITNSNKIYNEKFNEHTT